MKYYVVIPAHNEENYISHTLESLLKQTILPKKVVVVNDHSVDHTAQIVKTYTDRYNFIQLINNTSSDTHFPGAKVIRAFYKGLDMLDQDYDFIVKLDADIVLPENYFEYIHKMSSSQKIGVSGGILVEKDTSGKWRINHPMEKWHVRGAIKTYAKACFLAIGGLKKDIGWDTLDELLAIYKGFEVKTFDSLRVKHLRPVASGYNKAAKTMQGEAMYKMRYDLVLACIASLKMAYKQRKIAMVYSTLKGFIQAKKQKKEFVVTPEEGIFIRKFRYKQIFKKIGLNFNRVLKSKVQ